MTGWIINLVYFWMSWNELSTCPRFEIENGEDSYPIQRRSRTKAVITMNLSCVLPLSKLPNYIVPVTFPGSFFFLHNHQTNPSKSSRDFRSYKNGKDVKRRGIVRGWLLPVDPWAPNIDSESIASQLFAVSLFPYIGFLYFITKSKSAPKLTLFSFYFLLAFVGATSEFSWIYIFISQIFLLY